MKYGRTIAHEGAFQMLVAITRREESFDAFQVLRDNLERGAAKKRRRCTVGFPGGSREFDGVLRFPGKGFWALPTSGEEDFWKSKRRKSHGWGPPKNRFWCGYGVGNPRDGESLDITCEINPPYENPNLRYGGLFAKDGKGNVYLCHTGKIGGGSEGIGKKHLLPDIEELGYP